MAAGDAKNFNAFVNKNTTGAYNDTDSLALSFVSDQYSTVDSDEASPTIADLTVVSGGNVLAAYPLANVTFTRTTSVTSITADDIGEILKDASNPAPLSAVIYNTTVGNDLVKIYDLTADGVTAIDLVNNDLNLTFIGNELVSVINAST